MADVEQLVARLSLDMRQFRKEMLAAQGVSAKQARAVEQTWSGLNRKLNGIGQGIGRSLTAPLAGIAAAMSVREVVRYADAWTVAGNKIAAAGQIAGRQGRSLESINDIANRTRSGITETTDLYAKLLRSTASVAKSELEVAKATETVNKAFKAGGAAASEQAAGILQLSQGLGSGILQGDELRSVRENAPLLAQAIADEFKTTIAGLKQLGADGEITSARVFKAILAAQPKIEAAFNTTNQTISDGMTKVNNALTQYIGQTDSSLSVTGRLTAGLNALADNFDTVADTTLKLAAIIAGALVGRSIAGMVIKLGLGTAAVYRFVAALAAARTVAGVATAIGGMGAVAGPVGLVIGTVLTGALIAFGTQSGEASDAAKAYARALKEVEDAANSSADAAESASARYVEAEKQKAKAAVEFGENAIKKINRELKGAVALLDDWTMLKYVSREQIAQLKKLAEDLETGEKSAKEAHDELTLLAGDNPENKWLTEFLHPLIEGLDDAIRATKRLADEQRILAAGVIPQDPQFAGVVARGKQAATDQFLDSRTEAAKRTELERNIDTRTYAILKAAADIGVALTESAARIQASKEIATEAVVKAYSAGMSSAADLIKQSEGFRAQAYPDYTMRGGKRVNSGYRAGFGSDTVTLDDGSIIKITNGMSVTLADANRDLERRIVEFQDGIRGKIGANTFESFNTQQKAALTSIAYNYGSLPDRIVNAILKGDTGDVYNAIKSLGSDNSGINQKRRNDEAEMFLTGASPDIRGRIETEGDVKKSKENFQTSLEEYKQYIESLKEEAALRGSLNPLVDDYGRALGELEAAQYLLNLAQEEGTAAGLELSSAQQLLTGDLSNLTPEARAQAEAMRELAKAKGEVVVADALMAESQKELADTLKASSAFGKDVFGGLISDLKAGKSATEALSNALNKVADKLLEIGLNLLFDGLGTAGAGGGLLGGLFSFLFDKGGYTGDGGKHEPAGIVHKGEVVFSQDDVKRFGGARNLDRIRRGYESGGIVGVPNVAVPQIVRPPNVGGNASADGVHITVGVSADNEGNLRPFVESVARDNIRRAAPDIVQASVMRGQKETKRNMSGYIADAQARKL